MKSDEVTIWMVVKHIFGFHTWGKRIFPPPYEDDDEAFPGSYHVCEICGKWEI